MAAYPAEPFKQADSLLSGLLESYRSSSDAADAADIRSLVETTIKIARDREFRPQALIRELAAKVAASEAAGDAGDAKAAHKARMDGLDGGIARMQAAVQGVRGDLERLSDQQAGLQAARGELAATQAQLAGQLADPEPLLLKVISLYAHVSGLAFDYASLDGPVISGQVTGFPEAGIRHVSVRQAGAASSGSSGAGAGSGGSSGADFESVNALWAAIPCPGLPGAREREACQCQQLEFWL